jgi:hypothetical protein
VASFVNGYDYGDLKGDPRIFMERWFDIHLYLADWGTRRLMLRLPECFLKQADVDPFLREIDGVDIHVCGENVIVDICRDKIKTETYDDWDDGSGWLAALAPLRAEVLSGDFRLFYVAAELKRRIRIKHPASSVPCRTVGALRERASEIAEARERAAAERQEAEDRRQAEQAEKARRARLEELRQRGADVWPEIESEIERRNAAGYDKAMSLLSDLQALAVEEGCEAEFSRRLASAQARNEKKGKFIERLEKLSP